MKNQRTQPDKYIVSLKVNDTEIKAEGKTMLEALTGLKHPGKFNTLGVMTITKGELSTERVLNTLKLRSLFGNKVYPVVLAKNLELFLK
jgi:hypothetical protein